MSSASSKLSLLASGNASKRPSYDASINLNDDLVNESEIEGSVMSYPVHRLGSLRNSIDGESTFSGSAYFNGYNVNSIDDIGVEVSPLGPNSIFELTIASDQARIKQRRTKQSVVVNGGLTNVYNLVTPSTNDIPQIQLAKLKHKVSNNDLNKAYIEPLQQQYKKFELSYNVLTKDFLDKLNNDYIKASTPDSDIESVNDHGVAKIPEVFMNPDFRLDDPRIFKQVIENASILPNETDGDVSKSLANNTDLQEKFSSYLDTIELNLIQEISKSSDSFFTTMDDITNIKDQSLQVLNKYNATSQKLADLQTNQCKKGQAILSKMIEKKNVAVLESALLQLSYITKIFNMANDSYSDGNYAKCLNEIVTVESLIYGIGSNQEQALPITFNQPLQDLSTLPALIHIINDLQTLKNGCAKGFINDFINLLLGDVRGYYQSVPYQETLNRLYIASDKTKKYPASADSKSFQNIPADTKSKLSFLVENLVKSDHLIPAYSLYQDKLIAEIKSIIKQNFLSQDQANIMQHEDYSLADISQASSRASSAPPVEASDSSSGANTLSSSIKALTPKGFEDMIIKTFTNLSECLRRLTVHQKLLLDFALTYIPTSASIDVMSLDISGAINKAIELTQVRLTKVINVRLEQTADLPVSSYLRLYSISSSYLQECESINPGYMATGAGSSFSEWFKHHASYFIHRVHLKALKALVTYVDQETWREISSSTILNESQIILDEILHYSDYISTGSSEFTGDDWLDLLDFYEGPGKKIKPAPKIQNDAKVALQIGDGMYLVPNLVIKSLLQIKDYLTVQKMFPYLSPTLENNILNYFKLMNSRISQSVLNAGATRTAGLKHITTKHIALCIQTLEFDIALLPSIQAIFSSARTSTPPPVQNNNQQQDELSFQRITSNYKDHENELFAKLVAIMQDRTVNHCAAALRTNWSEPLSRQQQCHAYMETLVKETLTITKVLTKYLPEIKCSRILLQVFDNYKKSFVTCYCVDLPQPKDMMEKQLVLKDIDYFRSNLCDLPGYGNSGQVIWENVNSLPTVEDTRMEEKMRAQERASVEVVPEVKVNGSEESTKATKLETLYDVDEKVTPEPASKEVNDTLETANEKEKIPESGVLSSKELHEPSNSDESKVEEAKVNESTHQDSLEDSANAHRTDIVQTVNDPGVPAMTVPESASSHKEQEESIETPEQDQMQSKNEGAESTGVAAESTEVAAETTEAAVTTEETKATDGIEHSETRPTHITNHTTIEGNGDIHSEAKQSHSNDLIVDPPTLSENASKEGAEADDVTTEEAGPQLETPAARDKDITLDAASDNVESLELKQANNVDDGQNHVTQGDSTSEPATSNGNTESKAPAESKDEAKDESIVNESKKNEPKVNTESKGNGNKKSKKKKKKGKK